MSILNRQKSLCRVHWVLWNLTPQFKGKYILYYDYARHNYLFYRMEGHSLKDLFLIVRTSKRCFRVMYCNTKECVHEYFSCKTSEECAKYMEDISTYYDKPK